MSFLHLTCYSGVEQMVNELLGKTAPPPPPPASPLHLTMDIPCMIVDDDEDEEDEQDTER